MEQQDTEFFRSIPLPDEIVLHILEFLGTPSALSHFGLVSRHSLNLARDNYLWRRVYFSRFPKEPTFFTHPDEENWRDRYINRLVKGKEHALNVFSSGWEKGALLLDAEGYINLQDPLQTADFFYNLDPNRVNKWQIGFFFAHNPPVLQAFIKKLVNMTGHPLDYGWRKFQDRVWLPGQSKLVSATVRGYATVYFEQNNNLGYFPSIDSVFYLTYSMIVLNVDLHSQMIKHHMTRNDFVKNCATCPEPLNLPQGYLEGVYDRILVDKFGGADEAEKEKTTRRNVWDRFVSIFA